MSLKDSLPSSPRATFSATVRFSNSEKCWNTMPMPRARFRWSRQDHRLSLPAHLALARLDQSVDGLDQGRFSRAVLAEQRVDLLRPNIDIDGIVGEKSAVTLCQSNGLQERRCGRKLSAGRRNGHSERHAGKRGCLNSGLLWTSA